MRYFYRTRPYPEAEIQNAIETPDGLRAGWELEGGEASDWRWARVIRGSNGSAVRCQYVRDCSEEEKRLLSDLMHGEIVCRYFPTLNQKPWALASRH